MSGSLGVRKVPAGISASHFGARRGRPSPQCNSAGRGPAKRIRRSDLKRRSQTSKVMAWPCAYGGAVGYPRVTFPVA